MNSPVKLDSCLHIRFSMSALKGEAAHEELCEVLAQLFACCWCLSVTLPELCAPWACERRDVVGTDLLNVESSSIHICCLCLFGDQEVAVGQICSVFSHTGLLFCLIQVTDLKKSLLINVLTVIINISNFIAMTVQDDNCNHFTCL